MYKSWERGLKFEFPLKPNFFLFQNCPFLRPFLFQKHIYLINILKFSGQSYFYAEKRYINQDSPSRFHAILKPAECGFVDFGNLELLSLEIISHT